MWRVLLRFRDHRRAYGTTVSIFTVPLAALLDESSSIVGSANFPLIPGHEVIGKVVAVGPGEKKWKVGDRVGGPWHGGHDGTCKSCNRGLFQMCQNEAINGVTRNGGCKCFTILDHESILTPGDL